MINFLISFFLIFFSAYLFVSIIHKTGKTDKKFGAVFIFLLFISQIILSFEVLSVFKGIGERNFLILNSAIFVIALFSFIKTKAEPYRFNIISHIKDLFGTAKRDKSLFIAIFSILFFIVVSLFLTLISPVMYSDAMTYHLPRIFNFIQNSSLEHYPSHDMRMITMPFNSELLQAWIVLFIKKDFALSLFSFVSYLISVIVLFNFVKEIGFGKRKSLWAVFIFSALSFTITETSSADINLFTGSLILITVYLLFCSQKYKSNTLLYFSALSLSIASGVKTTALILVAFIFIILFFTLKIFKEENKKKIITKFTVFLILNFLIFSSYNYIQNLKTCHNPITTRSQYELNKFPLSAKGYISNIINYSFDYIDFAGFEILKGSAEPIFKANEKLHSLFGAKPNDFSSLWFSGTYYGTNFSMLETQVSFGLLGLLAFIPAMFISLVRYRRSKSPKKILYYLSAVYILTMLFFALSMVYTPYNVRYMTTFAFLILPIFALTYTKSNKNVYKILLILTCVYYLCFTSLHLNFKEVPVILKELKQSNITTVREKMRCSKWEFGTYDNQYCRIKQEIKEKYKDKEILVLPNFSDSVILLKPINTKYKLLSDIKTEDLNGADVIIAHAMFQHINKINKPKDENISCHYLDRNGKEIFEEISEKAVYCDCEIPYDYLLNKGLKPDKIIYDSPKTQEYNPETMVILSR